MVSLSLSLSLSVCVCVLLCFLFFSTCTCNVIESKSYVCFPLHAIEARTLVLRFLYYLGCLRLTVQGISGLGSILFSQQDHVLYHLVFCFARALYGASLLFAQLCIENLLSLY